MTHEDRVWHHEMETLEGIHEHAERIASLEELVTDMWEFIQPSCKECDGWVQLASHVGTCRLSSCKRRDELVDRMAKLGIEVSDDG